jgi:PKD repeat protein
MKSFFTLLLVLLSFSSALFSQDQSIESIYQNRSEYYFSVKFDHPKDLFRIGELVSVDDIKDGFCFAYANPKQFKALADAGFIAELLVPPSLQVKDLKMVDVDGLRETYEWDAYPTYGAYVAMMNAFHTDYPEMCTIENILTLESGHELLVARINNGNPDGKAQFLYSSSIHGDETTGYILTLRLIDYLLSNYGIDEEVTNLVDQTDIWICPLANPDGTYYLNDNTVSGSVRFNANGVDLNRNYADPEDGQHPDGNLWQPETVAFMNLAEEQHFTMGANFHGGAEVLNYPWDTWFRRHPDDAWWIFVCREYVDTVHEYAPNGYLTDLNNGITNGYDWYTITGGRQDYMNFYHQCREVTAEISSIKTLPASQLQAFWNYNYRSMLNYVQQATFGFTGTVIDSISREPIVAKLTLVGHDHDADSSHVYSVMPLGAYHRPVKSGTYDLTFSATGYYSKTLNDIQISDYESIVNNIELAPGTVIAGFEASATQINKNASVNFYDRSFGQNIISWQWVFEGAQPSTSTLQNPVNINYPSIGDFNVQLTVVNNQGQTDVILIEDYIHVNLSFIMQNTQVTTCEGVFYDNGGPGSNYTDDRDFTMTILPALADNFSQITFESFELEYESNCDYDWLRIYDGSNTSAPMLGEWCGTNSPGQITASNEIGSLTFVFHSDNSANGAGWAAAISCIPMMNVPEFNGQDVIIYPNPVSKLESLTIRSLNSIQEIQVIDMHGSVIRKITANGSKEINFAVTDLSPAVYVINVILENKTLTKRITIR